jgi:small subunit ribosomal protein S6
MMNEENKLYQITCFLAPTLDQQKLNEIIQKIKQWITLKGGSIAEETLSGETSNKIKRSLAYPIKKYQEAFYFNLKFLLAGQFVNELCQQLNLEKDILRYLITAKQKPLPGRNDYDVATTKPKVNQEIIDYKIVDKVEPLPTKESPQPTKKEEKKEEKKEKVKIEELDKKLEEILNE